MSAETSLKILKMFLRYLCLSLFDKEFSGGSSFNLSKLSFFLIVNDKCFYGRRKVFFSGFSEVSVYICQKLVHAELVEDGVELGRDIPMNFQEHGSFSPFTKGMSYELKF